MSSVPVSTAYVWRTPAFVSGAPVDHTWVTTYDNRVTPLPDIGAVVSAGEHYWFCWGSFHPAGNPPAPLRSGPLNLPLAVCLVLPNADSRAQPAARGTIFNYAADGVCHQLANQVLWAAKGPSGAPLTAAGANGYGASVFFWGVYGVQAAAWAAKKKSCASSAGAGGGGGQMANDQDDDFDAAARKILPPSRFEELKALRQRLRPELAASAAADIRSMPGERAAAEINARINQYLEEVAKLLTREQFQTLFGFAPGEKIELVDPNMVGSHLAASR